MKTCRRCGNEYDTEKVLCPACMTRPGRLQGRHRGHPSYRHRPGWHETLMGAIGPGQSVPVPPQPPPNRFELDANYIVTKSGERVQLDDGLCRTVFIDLNGILLTQPILDSITQAANAMAGYPVNIIIRRIGTSNGVPRLLADRGEIYDAVQELLSQKKALLERVFEETVEEPR